MSEPRDERRRDVGGERRWGGDRRDRERGMERGRDDQRRVDDRRGGRRDDWRRDDWRRDDRRRDDWRRDDRRRDGERDEYGPQRGRGRAPYRREPYERRGERPRRDEDSIKIDRTKTCPFLLRIFFKDGEHNTMDEWSVSGRTPQSEVKVHTWLDAKLGEIKKSFVGALGDGVGKKSHLSIRLVFPDTKGGFRMRPVARLRVDKDSEDDERTLNGIRCRPGDFMDISITQ